MELACQTELCTLMPEPGDPELPVDQEEGEVQGEVPVLDLCSVNGAASSFLVKSNLSKINMTYLTSKL